MVWNKKAIKIIHHFLLNIKLQNCGPFLNSKKFECGFVKNTSLGTYFKMLKMSVKNYIHPTVWAEFIRAYTWVFAAILNLIPYLWVCYFLRLKRTISWFIKWIFYFCLSKPYVREKLLRNPHWDGMVGGTEICVTISCVFLGKLFSLSESQFLFKLELYLIKLTIQG
jgi:hypothetical protein